MSTQTEKKIIFLSFITAFALSIYVLEMLIPRPLPFMKIGLSNVVIVFLIYSDLIWESFLITIAKTLIGGFITGTLLTPTSLMSLCGGMLAFVSMIIAYKTPLGLSIIGVSIIGSVFHNIGQLLAVNIAVIGDWKLVYFVPLMLFLGLVTGILTGYLAHLLVERLDIRRLYERTNL